MTKPKYWTKAETSFARALEGATLPDAVSSARNQAEQRAARRKAAGEFPSISGLRVSLAGLGAAGDRMAEHIDDLAIRLGVRSLPDRHTTPTVIEGRHGTEYDAEELGNAALDDLVGPPEPGEYSPRHEKAWNQLPKNLTMVRDFGGDFSRDSGPPKTVGDIAGTVRAAAKRGATDSELCDLIDREFLYGAWKHIVEKLPSDGGLFLKDVRGMLVGFARDCAAGGAQGGEE